MISKKIPAGRKVAPNKLTLTVKIKFNLSDWAVHGPLLPNIK
jgi:hypothetical protein